MVRREPIKDQSSREKIKAEAEIQLQAGPQASAEGNRATPAQKRMKQMKRPNLSVIPR